MVGGSFSSFSLLPGEIRDQIWDFSTRPIGARGVQYFSALDVWDNTRPIPEGFKRHTVSRTSENQNQILAAPLVGDETSCPSWYDANRSTYAIDGGLWTACKESRAAMYRRYRPEEWLDLWKTQRKHYYNKQIHFCDHIFRMPMNEKMPATFNVESDGRTQSLTIFPGYDLVHLTPLATGPDWNTLLRYIPFSSPEFGFGGIRHIAMDFDSSWNVEELEQYQVVWERIENLQERTQEEQMDSLRWEMYDSLVQATRETWCGLKTPTVWLVDHRLRRKSTVLDEHMTEMVFGRDFGSWHEEQLVFHAAGCRYYAMPEHYASQFCGYDAEDDPGCDDDVFSFVSELEDVGARQEALDNRGDDDWFDDEKKYYATTLRILVCERDHT